MAEKDIRFNFLMSEEEKRMLEELAKQDDRSAGSWLRAIIKTSYLEKFEKVKGPKRKR